jgi:HSP20 family protein
MSDKKAVSRSERAKEVETLLPRVDVFEDKDGILLVADLPGVPKDKLDLRVDNDTLTVEGEIATDMPDDMDAEVRLARYRRAFTLSSELDTARIDAQFRDGVLNLRIPKHTHAQPRQIKVKVA